jgi:hypothetical protein
MTRRPTARATGSELRACTALLCLAAGLPAAAQPGEGPALELGVRTGITLAFGDDFRGLGIASSSRYQSFVPIELDVGVRFPSGLVLGAYLQYGAALGKTCATGATCSSHLIRFGADALFHVRPRAQIDPWFGLGIGYDIATLAQAPAGQPETTTTLRGLELFHLQGGVDFLAAPSLRIGPFLMLALGRYTVATASQGGVDFTADIQNQSLHELLTFGVRAAFEVIP